jgi:hypothetical protein
MGAMKEMRVKILGTAVQDERRERELRSEKSTVSRGVGEVFSTQYKRKL